MSTDIELLEQGRKLFASPCEFIWGAVAEDNLPPIGPAEIAFAGRSNVGKSSLLNALTRRQHLARTSHTPGRTQQLNFFDLGTEGQARLRIVDMPGYGYAAVSKQQSAQWQKLIHAYLRGRQSLARVYLLVDARHGIKKVDETMLDALDDAAQSYQIILTKIDKLSDAAAIEAQTLLQLSKRAAAHPEVLFASSYTGEGIAELQVAIFRLLLQSGSRV